VKRSYRAQGLQFAGGLRYQMESSTLGIPEYPRVPKWTVPIEDYD
jgi:hypothetical protein